MVEGVEKGSEGMERGREGVWKGSKRSRKGVGKGLRVLSSKFKRTNFIIELTQIDIGIRGN